MPLPARTTPTRCVAVLLALSLPAGVFGAPSISLAADPPAPTLRMVAPAEAAGDPPRVSVRVDAEALGNEGDAIVGKAEEIAAKLVTDAGFSDPLDDRDPRVIVVIERAGDPENPGYVIGFSVEQGDEVVPGSARQSDCSLCTRTELVERIEQELPALIELAGEHQVERASGEGGGDGGSEDGGGEDGGEDGGDEIKPIGPLGFAGIGVGVLGLGGVGAGVGLVVKGVEPIPGTTDSRNFQTPGYAVLALGGVALVAGVVMIALDVSKRKQARSAKQDARVRWIGNGVAF